MCIRDRCICIFICSSKTIGLQHVTIKMTMEQDEQVNSFYSRPKIRIKRMVTVIRWSEVRFVITNTPYRNTSTLYLSPLYSSRCARAHRPLLIDIIALRRTTWPPSLQLRRTNHRFGPVGPRCGPPTFRYKCEWTLAELENAPATTRTRTRLKMLINPSPAAPLIHFSSVRTW